MFLYQGKIRQGKARTKIKGLIPRYDGLCRSLSIEEAREKIANGEEYVVRLKLPANKDITFTDLVRGEITINTEDLDDQVLLKSDGFPTYHMAVVVDDHLMGVTHIVRGEEWLPSTPKHVYLYEAFGWEKPTYVHLPTVLNKDRKKLSKRHGDVSVEDFRKKGYLPEGLVNYLALVGWAPESNKEILTMEELIEEFSFERVSKTGGIFDKEKLDWVNGHYIRSYDLDKLTKIAIPFLKEAGYIDDKFAEEKYEWLKILVETVREGLSNVSEIVDAVDIFFRDTIEVEDEDALDVLKWEETETVLKAFKAEVESVDEIDQEFSKTVMKKIQKATGIKGKSYLCQPGLL